MTNPFKKFRIDSLFFRSYSILIVAVLACIVWASYSISSNALVKTSSHYQQKLLDELNNEISTQLVMIEQISLSITRDNKLISLFRHSEDAFDRYQNADKVKNALANLTFSIPIIQGIELYMDRPFQEEENGYIQFWDLKDLDKQGWNQYLDENDFSWGAEQEVPSFQGNVPVLSFARKIVFDDSYLGVVVIHVKAKEIRALLSGHSHTANRMMTDSKGQIFVNVGEYLDDIDLNQWLDMKTQQSGYKHIRENSSIGDSLLVYSKLNNSNWTLVELTSWREITADSYRLAEVIGIIGVAAVLLVLILTLYISKQFTKPIKELVAAMTSYSIGANTNNTELPKDYQNEFGYLFSGYRKQNERIEELYLSLQRRHEQQRKAEIEALQANINPHFLYNMLDQLNWMAIEAGQDELSRILELMGRMFRIGLSNGDSFITIEKELEHITCYLEIQQIRWGEGLSYSIDAPAEIMDMYIPKLTLQPFVENSIVHGFNTRLSGHVHIQMSPSEQVLQIMIQDNGIGLQQKVENKKQRHTGGYGIRNVKDRINGYFGGAYRVILTERDEGGTQVELTLPLLRVPPMNES